MLFYVTSLTAREAAHAMPVLQSVLPILTAAPAPRVAAIRQLAQRAGVADGALRTALSRASAAGSLQVTDGRYSLGPQSLEEAAAARALMARVPGYCLAAILEGEAPDLPALRDLSPGRGSSLSSARCGWEPAPPRTA